MVKYSANIYSGTTQFKIDCIWKVFLTLVIYNIIWHIYYKQWLARSAVKNYLVHNITEQLHIHDDSLEYIINTLEIKCKVILKFNSFYYLKYILKIWEQKCKALWEFVKKVLGLL